MSSAKDLRAEALRVRKLAREIVDEHAQRTLIKLAAENDARAAARCIRKGSRCGLVRGSDWSAEHATRRREAGRLGSPLFTSIRLPVGVPKTLSSSYLCSGGRNGSVSFRALELGKLRPSSPALKLLPGQSRFSAYVASAALQREHVGAYGIGIVESFAVRHSRGSSVPLIQCSSVQASVDIDP
jgi:hypothetical protein